MNLRSASAVLVLLVASASCRKKAEKKAEAPARVIDAAPGRPAEARVIVPETMVLRQVLLETSEPARAYDLDTERLGKRLGASLVRSGWIAARDSEVPDDHLARRVEALLNISYDVTLPVAGEPGTMVIAIEAILQFIDDRAALQPRVALIVELGLTTSREAEVTRELNSLAMTALESVAESLVARERLRRAPHEELLSVLSVGSDDVSTKIWALQLAADRGLREAVPAAIEALSHEDEDVRAAAIAALVSFGDARAVAALIKDVDFKDYEELRVILEAVSAIGGSDAIEFLEYVASGHPDDEMRDRAKENMEQARRRAVPSSDP